MKTYLLPIFALLIVGCGNQHQQQAENVDATTSSSTEQTDSIKKIPPIIEKHIREEIAQNPLLSRSYVDSLKIDLLDAIKGDFNGNGKIDIAYLYKAEALANNKLSPDEDEWLNGIAFSDMSIPTSGFYFIPFMCDEYNFFTNEGDIDNNGVDEIGFRSEARFRFAPYSIYSLRNGEWKMIMRIDSDGNEQNPQNLVRIASDRKGYVIIKTPAYDITTGQFYQVEELKKIE